MTRVMALLLFLGLAAAHVLAAPEPGTVGSREAQKLTEDGQKELQKQNFEKAADKLRAAVEKDPAFAPAHCSLGQARMALKRYAEAAQSLERCKELIAGQGAEQQKASADQDARRRQEIQEVERSLAVARSSRVREGARGYELQLEQRLRELQNADMKGAAQRTEIPADISLLLGSAYFRLQRLPEAETNYLEAIRVNPKLGEAHNNLAVVYMLTRRFEDARLEIAAAERAGFPVSEAFKKDLETRAAAPK